MHVGGSNVFPAEVEAALEEHPQVKSCAVIGIPDSDLGQKLVAIVHLNKEVSDKELTDFLAERLAPYKLPRSFQRVDDHVRGDDSKVRRSALAMQYQAKSKL